MLKPALFYKELKNLGIDFVCGVPDSTLKYFISFITENAINNKHIICANEGAAIGLAIGYHLATNKIAAVYMQNSGLGNATNPLLSLADQDVYSIPILLVIGWRGEPRHKDEPQHKKQGRITLELLKAMQIKYEILKGTFDTDRRTMEYAVNSMIENRSPYALVVPKNIFSPYEGPCRSKFSYSLKRDEAVKIIISGLAGKEVVISTTGFISRELYEHRENFNQGHAMDFLTVGGMGHCSQIALGIAIQKPQREIFCIDGDGSIIMHMGSMAINGNIECQNLNHILLNNGSHGSVGGQPTVGFKIDFQKIAKAVGYKTILYAESGSGLKRCLADIKSSKGPKFLEVRLSEKDRGNIGRPAISPIESKKIFMEYLSD